MNTLAKYVVIGALAAPVLSECGSSAARAVGYAERRDNETTALATPLEVAAVTMYGTGLTIHHDVYDRLQAAGILQDEPEGHSKTMVMLGNQSLRAVAEAHVKSIFHTRITENGVQGNPFNGFHMDAAYNMARHWARINGISDIEAPIVSGTVITIDDSCDPDTSKDS